MGRASFSQQLLALLRRNWTFKLRNGKTTLQVCKIIHMCSAFCTLNVSLVTGKSCQT